jgi:hypothetical protein
MSDKLRETADEIQRIKNNNADWLWRDAATLADAAGQLRDAADLILELRDGLQRANAENEKLIVKLNAEHIVRQNVEIENVKLKAQECTLESMHGYCDPYVRTAYVVELSCHTLDAWDDPVPPSYCPYCGKRVVEVDG